MGSRLGGVHFELTGENVTECTGGPEKLCEADLPHVSCRTGIRCPVTLSSSAAHRSNAQLRELLVSHSSSITYSFDPSIHSSAALHHLLRPEVELRPRDGARVPDRSGER